MIGQEQKAQVVKRAADVPPAYNAVDILERNLDVQANKVALYSPERSLTFGQVSSEVNQVANALSGRLGVRLGDSVAILSLDRPEWVTSFFGIVKAGAVAVSLNTMATPRDCTYILRDSRTRVLIVDEALLPAIDGVRDEAPFLERVVVIGSAPPGSDLTYTELIDQAPSQCAAAPTHRDDACMLNYSSGTTGEPKGIPHAQKDLPLTAQLYAIDAIGLREDDVTFSVAKLYFTYGSGSNLIWPWYAGASVILATARAFGATLWTQDADFEDMPRVQYRAVSQ